MTLSQNDAINKYGIPKKQQRLLIGNMVGEFWNRIYFSFFGSER